MSTTRIRLLALPVVVIALAGCGSTEPVAPSHQLRPTAPARIEGESIPNPDCRSGYSGPNGRCL